MVNVSGQIGGVLETERGGMMLNGRAFRKLWLLVAVAALFIGLLAPSAYADHPDPDPGNGDLHEYTGEPLELPNQSQALEAHDALADVVSSEPSARNVKSIAMRGLGERADAGATTDVWVLGNHAYTGTFNSPCGGDSGAGIWIWDVRNPNKAKVVDIIESPVGSRSNDVKVAAMNSGDILVHSNESCDNGPGGFEIFNVDNPNSPVHLASVRIDELAQITPFFFVEGALEDVGVHNLFLFTQGDNDYVAAQAEGVFDGFRIYDITDPTNPTLMSGWGAEEVFDPGVGDLTPADDPAGSRTLSAVLWMLGFPPFNNFGGSTNRFLHDFTISADGTDAYLAHWDAGLILLDISDVSDPQLVSVALDPENGSLDQEVNSHSVWPSEDGTIVVEGEEDFDAWEPFLPPEPLTLDSDPATGGIPGDPTIPGTAISTLAGDDFEANPTGNFGSTDGASVVVDSGPLAGESYLAAELSTAEGSPTFSDVGTVSGEFVWIGRGCSGDPILNSGAIDEGDIVVVRRGACFFEEKENTAASLGAAAVVIANNEVESTPWSGLRIWDYSDPANPVLASTFNTACSVAVEPSEECRLTGTYSAHNVIVETTGNMVKAYVSWYSDGMLVLDVTDPKNPVEVGRYLDNTVNANGEPNNFWGVYKVAKDPFLFGSDRNGGLYIFKEQGSGSGG